MTKVSHTIRYIFFLIFPNEIFTPGPKQLYLPSEESRHYNLFVISDYLEDGI